jgi:hypothetical protein
MPCNVPDLQNSAELFRAEQAYRGGYYDGGQCGLRHKTEQRRKEEQRRQHNPRGDDFSQLGARPRSIINRRLRGSAASRYYPKDTTRQIGNAKSD